MRKIQHILFMAGIVLLTLLAILWIPRWKSQRKDGNYSEEISTEIQSIMNHPYEATSEDSEETILSQYTFIHIDTIYYVSDMEEFKLSIIEYLLKNKITATTINILSLHEDDLTDADDKVYFYFQIDDAKNSVFQIIYDKSDHTFAYRRYADPIKDIENYGGIPQGYDERQILSTEETPFDTEEETIILSEIQIYDLDESLNNNVNVEAFRQGLETFLQLKGEERRNFYVDSFEKDGDGFEMILQFEAPRSDGKVIVAREESYGVYSFRLIQY